MSRLERECGVPRWAVGAVPFRRHMTEHVPVSKELARMPLVPGRRQNSRMISMLRKSALVRKKRLFTLEARGSKVGWVVADTMISIQGLELDTKATRRLGSL